MSAAPLGEFHQQCKARCEACSRCRFASFYPKLGLCAWYAHCDLDDLRTWWNWRLSNAEWWTTALPARELPPPQPLPALTAAAAEVPLRLGVGTLLMGHGQHCALYGWCQSAQRLKAALEGPWARGAFEVELFLLSENGQTPAEASDCGSELRVIRASEKLKRAFDTCVGRRLHHRGFNTGMHSKIM